MGEAGVDSIELGIPFSDPVADGPVIEKANLKALQNGFKMDDLFYVSSKTANRVDTLWMGYFNPFYHQGVEHFISKANEYGVSGFIIPDLPYEEARFYKERFQQNGIALIDFVAPTDSKERIEQILQKSQKFIYMVAYAGITGSGQSEDLTEVIQNVRAVTNTPLYVGFGVNEQNAKEKVQGADGVIVGSLFVNVLLDEHLTNSQKIAKISSLVSAIKDQINS
jgi:tryptophan synthase alpha chain